PLDMTADGRVSFLDKTFMDWLTRTGELPPDFSKMPSIPFLPDPLILEEGTKNIPITTVKQWQQKRDWMKKSLQHYITGTYPMDPGIFNARVLKETKEGSITLRLVELSFGPEHKAKLTLELLIPEGKGPFPVFLTQWTHRSWAHIAVRRGYIGCIYAGGDSKDDTESYSEIWSDQYDFTRLMRRAFGASRAIDYLYSLPYVDKEKIGLTGHSRNGKTSLMAAAFDERISAVIPSSGVSGGEVPWRYATHKYDVEDIALLSSAQPSWLHPRLRFFVGRESKLPVDQNLFMALIAPRGLMLSAANNEMASNPWGIEQAYLSTKKTYEFLGAENNIAIRFRPGLHGTKAGDIEDYIDFFDYIFKRSDRKPENKMFYNYSFESWRKLSGEKINPLDYPSRGINDLLININGEKIQTLKNWEIKKSDIEKQIKWILGEKPPGVSNKINGETGENYFGSFLQRPLSNHTMGRMSMNSFGDDLYGYLYYPKDQEENIKSGKNKLPVLIYLHEYDYAKGFSSQYFDHEIKPFFEDMIKRGYMVFAYDFMGFGNRIDEGTNFYQRYRHWSKMGKLVTDVEGTVTALSNLKYVDSSKIFVAGYSLGASVGLYAAALDKRIAGVVSVSGFTPMRNEKKSNGTEGIRSFYDLHGLIPRLGFFEENKERIPFDFHELLASIAPRPLLIIAPEHDQDAVHKDVKACVMEVEKVYTLYGLPQNVQIYSPKDYNRFSKEMQNKLADWAMEKRFENE
ncbi:MAG: prolyl oligopeptidase family serine peptidase, partial [Ginsengibacter sp.]